MSVGRYIMHQKLSDGSYEDVYCKSESGLIYRPNGRTVEQDLAAYLPEYQNSDTVPESLGPGKFVTTNQRTYAGVSGVTAELITSLTDPSAEFIPKEIEFIGESIVETGDNYSITTTAIDGGDIQQVLTIGDQTITKQVSFYDDAIVETITMGG